MGKCNISLSPWGLAGGAVNSPLTETALAWLERTPFVSVRDRRDPAAWASECFGATPWGGLENVTKGRFGDLQIGVYRYVK